MKIYNKSLKYKKSMNKKKKFFFIIKLIKRVKK